MNVGPNIAAPASLIGDPARAAMISVLLGGQAYPATVLAARAGVTAQTASAHLAKLAAGGLVKAARSGRYRLYCLGSNKVADALEALAAISPLQPVTSLHGSDESKAMNLARMCYDHLAGFIGVGITDELLRRKVISPLGGAYEVTRYGRSWLARFGVDPDSLTSSRRKLATQCLDWSERRQHVGGAFGAAIARRALALGWFARRRATRGLAVTEAGWTALRQDFGIDGRLQRAGAVQSGLRTSTPR